jgi:hypothetical protein
VQAAGYAFSALPQQFLYFFPLPQGQGSFRPTFFMADAFLGCRGPSPASRASVGLAVWTRSGVTCPFV